MWVPYAVTAAGVCCLVLLLTMGETAEGFKSTLEHDNNAASYSRAFENKMNVVGADDDDDDDDDDSSDDGMEKLGFMDEDDDNDDDGDVYGFLEEDDNNDDDDDDSDDGMEKLGFMDEDDGNDDDGDKHGAIQEHGKPSKDYINELLKDDNKDKKKNNKPAQAAASYYYLRRSYIYHGTRIALQWKPYSRYWLDCGTSSHTLCMRSVCPSMYFDSSDSRRCSGVFFNIYRHRGSGLVRNGDIVALYNPTRRQWFGCPGRYCGRASCPGSVNSRFGFYSHEQWLRCYGEVFVIYARNKRVGAAISEQDQVALYYLQQHTWVQGSFRWLYKSTCMGTARPPHNSRFERCYTSTFEIHKR